MWTAVPAAVCWADGQAADWAGWWGRPWDPDWAARRVGWRAVDSDGQTDGGSAARKGRKRADRWAGRRDGRTAVWRADEWAAWMGVWTDGHAAGERDG